MLGEGHRVGGAVGGELDHADVEAVGDHHLGVPRGEAAVPVRRLQRRRRQHVAGGRGDGRARVAGEADRHRAAIRGQPERLHDLRGRTRVGDRDRDVVGREQGRGRQGLVHLGPGPHPDPDPEQPGLQLVGDARRAADAVHVDAPSRGDRPAGEVEGMVVELVDGLGDGADVGVRDHLDDLPYGVVGADLHSDVHRDARRRRAALLLGQGEPQLGVAGEPDGLGEPRDRRLRHAGASGQRDRGEPGRLGRVRQHGVRHLPQRTGQPGRHGADQVGEVGGVGDSRVVPSPSASCVMTTSRFPGSPSPAAGAGRSRTRPAPARR